MEVASLLPNGLIFLNCGPRQYLRSFTTAGISQGPVSHLHERSPSIPQSHSHRMSLVRRRRGSPPDPVRPFGTSTSTTRSVVGVQMGNPVESCPFLRQVSSCLFLRQ